MVLFIKYINPVRVRVRYHGDIVLFFVESDKQSEERLPGYEQSEKRMADIRWVINEWVGV